MFFIQHFLNDYFSSLSKQMMKLAIFDLILFENTDL